MNTYFLSSIEDTIQWLAAPEQADPRNASRAARKRELAERAPQQAATEAAESSDLASQYLHEAEGEPNLAADVARQRWAAPYNNDYLVVTFHPNAAFKALDVVALSSKEDLSFDDLKAAAVGGDRRNSLETVQPFALKGRPWLTSISVSEAKAGGALYLHCFFVARAQHGKGAIARGVVRRKLFDACPELAQIENPHNEGGVAQVAHPAIPPHRIPDEDGASAKLAHDAPQVSANLVVPYQRLFLTLTPSSTGLSPWTSYVVINVEMAPGQKPDPDDYIALALHYPESPNDYYTYEYVSNLNHDAYATWETCNKTGPTVADLGKLETLYVFYARKVNGVWKIIGNPTSYKMQKRWMEESLPDIGQKKLHEIVIPGAHDVGTYDLVAPGAALNAQAQNLDFPGQLALGTRYFDCRLWNHKSYTQPFYFYHGAASSYTEITDLTKALTDFLVKDNSKDIVILDFCRFGNFDPPAYDKLFALFRNDPLLANAMMTPDEAQQLTINELVAWGKRLFILCEDASARAKFNLGKSINIDAQWAEAHDPSRLKTWLNCQVNNLATSGKLWALQAVLTPRCLNSLAPYAVELFPLLHGWVANEWWNKANVVFCDFTAGTDLVNAVKVCNQRRNDKQKGNIFWYEHKGWQTGTGAPSPGVEIGHGGWTNFKSVFASSGGWIYAIDWYGNLNRYHDTNWRNAVPMSLGPSQTISSDNWLQYREVFASSDASGNRLIYAITGNYLNPGTGKLLRWRDTGGNQLGQGTLIDAGWENYKLAFASNDGVIYAIDSIGKLWRWHDTGSNKLQGGTPIDAGWENYKTVFATSNGVIYGIDWRDNLWWWRDAGGNQLGNGKQVGAGWSDFRMIFATSEGRFYGIKE